MICFTSLASSCFYLSLFFHLLFFKFFIFENSWCMRLFLMVINKSNWLLKLVRQGFMHRKYILFNMSEIVAKQFIENRISLFFNVALSYFCFIELIGKLLAKIKDKLLIIELWNLAYKIGFYLFLRVWLLLISRIQDSFMFLKLLFLLFLFINQLRIWLFL